MALLGNCAISILALTLCSPLAAPAQSPICFPSRTGILALMHRVDSYQIQNTVMPPTDRNRERGTWYTGVSKLIFPPRRALTRRWRMPSAPMEEFNGPASRRTPQPRPAQQHTRIRNRRIPPRFRRSLQIESLTIPSCRMRQAIAFARTPAGHGLNTLISALRPWRRKTATRVGATIFLRMERGWLAQLGSLADWSHPSGLVEDFHLQAVNHARRRKKTPGQSSPRRCACNA
jgi:hypothetical protein